MSSRFIRVTAFIIVIAGLLAATYIITKTDNVHPKIDTVGKIVYISDADAAGLPHVWIVSQTGGDAKDLSPGSQSCSDPAFSPDGSQIAYVSDKDGESQVYVMDADGKNSQKVTFGSSSKESPEFSPDGKVLAYLSHGTLTAITLDTRQPQLLLPPSSAGTSGIAAETTTDPNATPYVVLQKTLLASPVIKYRWRPASRSGADNQLSIAAVQDSDDDNFEGVTILTTLDAVPKVLPLAPIATIAWAPDGSELYAAIIGAKAGNQQSDFSGIVQISPSGDPIQKQPLAEAMTNAFGPYEPAVSPDGSRVLFSLLNAPNITHQQIIGLFSEPADGSSQPALVAKGTLSNVQWSPDGSSIIVLAAPQHATKKDLWVLPQTVGAKPVNLTNGTGAVVSAQWSPSVNKPS